MPKRVEIDLNQLETLARLGCTIEEAAEFFEVAERTMIRYLHPENRNPVYRQRWKKGQAAFKVSLRRLLYQHAQGKGSPAVQAAIHLSKFALGMSEGALRREEPKPNPADPFAASSSAPTTTENVPLKRREGGKVVDYEPGSNVTQLHPKGGKGKGGKS